MALITPAREEEKADLWAAVLLKHPRKSGEVHVHSVHIVFQQLETSSVILSVMVLMES